MLQAYKEEKNRILKQYEKLLTLSNIFPKSITVDDIKEKRSQLEDEHFFVSFTGQIKSGKSTLINALIFGEEIIPTDDTPHTAKITIIKYGKEPRLEATFYDKEEWEILKSNESFYNEFLKPDIENSISNGVFVEELIHASAKVKRESSLDNLKEYVARDGKYTPFVNLVTIYYPNETLKDITVVDTPGTNDPNRLRDKVAKEWIHKTNANIYITYANQAMDKIDIDFIDNFLMSVPKEQKLTVINKIDSVNDTDGLEEYIDELLNDETLRRREIVSTRDSLILVSGLGALIDKMLLKDFPLSDNLHYYAAQLDEKGFLEPKKHKISTLEDMISKKLIENKGQNILNAHTQFLNSIFKRQILEAEERIEVTKSSLSDLFKSKEELKGNRKSIVEIIEFLADKKRKINKNFSHLVKKNMDTFHSIQIKQNIINIDSIKREIEAIDNTLNYKNEVLWIVKQRLDNNFDELKEKLEEITTTLTKDIQKDIDTLKEGLIKKDRDISISLTSQTFSIYTLELISGMKELAEKQFKKENINRIVEENTNIWQRIFDTKRGLEQINSEIMSEVKKFFGESSRSMEKRLEEMLNRDIHEKIVEELMNKLSRIMNNKRDEVDRYIKNEEDTESLIKSKKVDKILLEKELKEIKKYQNWIK